MPLFVYQGFPLVTKILLFKTPISRMNYTFIKYQLILCLICSCMNPLLANPEDSALLQKGDTMADLSLAISTFKDVQRRALQQNNAAILSKSLSSHARRLVAAGMIDSARNLSEYAIELCQKGKAENIEVFYNIKGATLHYGNQLDSAIVYYLKAIKIYETKNDSLKASTIRFNVGNLFLSHRNYEKAQEQFKDMLNTTLRYGDSTYLGSLYTLLSTTEQQIGSVSKAIEFAQKGLAISTQRNDVLGVMLANRQLGQIANSEGQYDAGVKYLTVAQELAEKIKMPYYLALTYLGLAEAYEGLGNFPEAVNNGIVALKYAEAQGFGSYLGTLYRTLSSSYAKQGKYKLGYDYQLRYTRFQDSVAGALNKEIVNNLLIKYETAKKDQRLTEQNLSIQKQRNKIQLFSGLITLLSIAGLLMFYLQRSRNKQKMEANHLKHEKEVMQALLQGEEKERQRLSAELHDNISNGLYQCKLMLSKPGTEPAVVLDAASLQIEQLIKDSRNLAHQLAPESIRQLGLIKTLEKHIQFLNELPRNIKFFARFPFETTPLHLNTETQLLLFRVVQELTGNILKHSEATEAFIQFQEADREYSITIEDNGKGFDYNKAVQDSTSLKSLENRLELIGATINWQTTPEKGTAVQIHLSTLPK